MTVIMQAQKVYCVVPVYNRLEVTKRFLESMNMQDYPELHLVIINDGSTDGTTEYLAQGPISNLTVLNGDGSLWWGGGMYLGIEHVSKCAGKDDYLLMLNDDVRVEHDYVSTLVAESIEHGGAIIGSTQRDEITGRTLGSGYKVDYFGMRFLQVEAEAQCGEIDALPGRGVLFPLRAVLLAGNICKKAFRHYLGDLEYSARLREMGERIVISKKASVFTCSVSSDEQVRCQGRLKEYFSFRSKNNLKQRLFFFSVRGPVWLRVWAIPRYFFVGGYRLLRNGKW